MVRPGSRHPDSCREFLDVHCSNHFSKRDLERHPFVDRCQQELCSSSTGKNGVRVDAGGLVRLCYTKGRLAGISADDGSRRCFGSGFGVNGPHTRAQVSRRMSGGRFR
jgi:hypothetical protein